MKSLQRLNKRDHRVLGPYRSALTGLREAASTLPDLLNIHDVGGHQLILVLPLVIVILLSDCLQYSNSAINPVLYAFLSDNFKKSFRKACHCDKREVTGLGHNQDCSATTR